MKKLTLRWWEHYQHHNRFPSSGPAGTADPLSTWYAQLELVADSVTHQAGAIHAMVSGPGAVGYGPQSETISDIRDGYENTLAFIELSESEEFPAYSRVLDIRRLDHLVDASGMIPYDTVHSRGRALVFIDGSIFRLVKPISVADLKALITIAGGESLRRDDLEKAGIIKFQDRHYDLLSPDG